MSFVCTGIRSHFSEMEDHVRDKRELIFVAAEVIGGNVVGVIVTKLGPDRN